MRNVTRVMHAAYLQWLGSWCRLGGVRLPRGSGSRGPPCQGAGRRAGRPLTCSRARNPSYTCVKETCFCLVTTCHSLMIVFRLLLFHFLQKSDVVLVVVDDIIYFLLCLFFLLFCVLQKPTGTYIGSCCVVVVLCTYCCLYCCND